MQTVHESKRPSQVRPVVRASSEAAAYIRERGGYLYVRADRHRCCGGSMTLLAASTEPPVDGHDWRMLPGDGFSVLLDPRFRGLPDELVMRMRGVFRRRIQAYWNGCAFVL